MKIGIIGTRGIPNHYGGFEKFAERLSVGLVKLGHDVTVYNSHKHPFQENEYQSVQITHRFDPEFKIGTAGQFIYDFNCIRNARKQNFDIILQLGYTSSSIWYWLMPKKAKVLTNIDGMEWKRSKYSKSVRKFLRYAERLAIRNSHTIIADSLAMQDYVDEQYNENSVYLAYGADTFKSGKKDTLEEFGIEPFSYNMLVARLEPENNIETILDGVLKSSDDKLFLVVGNYETPYGQKLRAKYPDARIRFLNGIYDLDALNNLRFYSHIYFHGHSVGGTNPSLLEAMGSNCLICAHNNPFNKAILGDDAHYFMDEIDVKNLLELIEKNENEVQKIKNNMNKIEERFSWKLIIEQYELTMKQALI